VLVPVSGCHRASRARQATRRDDDGIVEGGSYVENLARKEEEGYRDDQMTGLGHVTYL
jgi:hypothetical protein